MKQTTALEILKTGHNVFLTGSAGTGKTHLLNQYIDYLKERDIALAITAPTGIAASHINGMTIHSFFGIGIRENIDEYFLDSLIQKEFLHKRLNKLKVLIIDEISMVSPELFRSIDKILRAFKYSDQPFGGLQLVLSGDFFQLPPVSISNNTSRFAWQAEAWKNAELKSCYLTEKFRQSDQSLINILDEIRSGDVSEESMEVFRSCYKKELKSDFKVTKLYTHNKDVDRINEKELELLKDKPRLFQSRDKGSKNNLAKIFKTSLVKEELALKKKAVVIFIKNNYEAGYINGTLGEIIGFDKDSGAPIVKIFSGHKIIAEHEDWKLEDHKGEVKATVSQVPLRLAWALTIHKSQGMTLDAAEIDLSKTFETGQGYVALSRIKSTEGLRLMGLNNVALQVDQLILSIDKKIKEASLTHENEFQNINTKEKEILAKEFIIKNNGTVNEDKISTNKKELKTKSDTINISTKTHTLELTKNLLAKKKNISEIAKARNISAKTIISHIKKISKLYPDFNLNHLKPKQKVLNTIFKAIKKIELKNNPDNLLKDGSIKLKVIFDYLKEEILYDDIALALIFYSKKL
jgi:ATP-dependent DNA helicase PIF1